VCRVRFLDDLDDLQLYVFSADVLEQPRAGAEVHWDEVDADIVDEPGRTAPAGRCWR
jgi:hypothetical protein